MITTVCKISYGSQTVPPIVPAVQGDTGRAISFEIADFTPPAGATATYFILKPSGEAIYNSATITNNSILCELTAQSLAEAGENRMQVRVLLGEDIVTSFEVILMVRTFLGDDAIESGTEMNIFDQAVEQATEEFQEQAEQIVEEVIESIPADYTALTEEVDELNERIEDFNEYFNINLTSGVVEGASISASGTIVTTSDGNNTYYADVDGLTKVIATGGSLYGFYASEPAFGVVSLDGTRHEEVLSNTEITLPNGTKYLAIRARTAPTIQKATGYPYVSIASQEYTGDWNDLPQGSFVTRTSSGATMATHHVPNDGFVGSVITVGIPGLNYFKGQIAIGGGNTPQIYWRQFYSSWGNWNRFASTDDLGAYVTLGKQEYTGDWNDLPQGSFVTRTSNGATVALNHVPNDGFVGSVITVGIPGINYFKGQIAIGGGNTKYLFWRQYYTSWGDWNQVATLGDIDTHAPLDILPAFSNITCCGDSLTQSIVYTGNGASDYRNAYVPYPQVLSRLTGVPVAYHAVGGYTAINWWNAFQNEIVQKDNQLAIIYLGTNGGLTDTLATDAPENTDYSTWANTNTGCYAKMIAKFKSVGANVILVKTYAGPSDPGVATTNKVIKDMADRFQCGLVDNEMLTDNVYHYFPDRTGTNTPHYNDLGYSAFAKYLSNKIATMDKNYMKWILPQ